jgi:hypothetical protein
LLLSIESLPVLSFVVWYVSRIIASLQCSGIRMGYWHKRAMHYATVRHSTDADSGWQNQHTACTRHACEQQQMPSSALVAFW